MEPTSKTLRLITARTFGDVSRDILDAAAAWEDLEKKSERLAAYIVMLEDAWMNASGVTSQDRRGARALNRARQGVDFDLGRPTDAAIDGRVDP